MEGFITIPKAIGIDEVATIFGCKKTKAWELTRRADFPKRFNVGRVTRWIANEVIDYREKLRNEQNAKEAA